MNRRRLARTVLTAFLLVIGCVAGPAFPAPGTYTISLDSIGVTFKLPKGYAVLQREILGGGYATIISLGKEFSPGHLKYVPLEIMFWPTGHDGKRPLPEYTPRQYVDVEFQRVKESVRQHLPGFESEPEYVKLFGNKAVRYVTYGLDSYNVIVGYLSVKQLPKAVSQPGDYLARITVTRGVPDVEFDRKYKELVDTVVNSLRIIR